MSRVGTRHDHRMTLLNGLAALHWARKSSWLLHCMRLPDDWCAVFVQDTSQVPPPTTKTVRCQPLFVWSSFVVSCRCSWWNFPRACLIGSDVGTSSLPCGTNFCMLWSLSTDIAMCTVVDIVMVPWTVNHANASDVPPHNSKFFHHVSYLSTIMMLSLFQILWGQNPSRFLLCHSGGEGDYGELQEFW